MQKSYVSALYELIKKDERVISCLSDSGTDYDELIAREFPKQVINFGISENNKVAAAAGMASCGKIPFVYTTGAFLAYRSYEFIRDDVCLQNQNVKLVGMGVGLAWSTLGCTHHSTEDISVLKPLPNLTILSPCSPKELTACINAAYEIEGPVYVRMGMSGEEEIYEDECNFVLGKNNIVRRGKDITIFVTSSIISEVLKAAQYLNERDNIDAEVINVATIKPFDKESVLEAAKKTKQIFTVEEHSVIGGLGSSVADVIAENQLSVKLNKIGLQDCLATGYGTLAEVRAMNGLDAEGIYSKIASAIV